MSASGRIRIREARLSDYQAVLELYPNNTDYINVTYYNMCHDKNFHQFIAEVDSRVVRDVSTNIFTIQQ